MEDEMNNIAIVGADNDKIKDFAHLIANKVGYEFIDMNECFENYLLINYNLPIDLVNEVLELKETQLVKKMAKKNNVLLFISDDMFLSNQSYLILKDCLKILIYDKNKKEIDHAIQETIKKYCDLSMEQEKIDINEIIKKISI